MNDSAIFYAEHLDQLNRWVLEDPDELPNPDAVVNSHYRDIFSSLEAVINSRDCGPEAGPSDVETGPSKRHAHAKSEEENKKGKRKRYSEQHRLSGRLRRQKMREKVNALQQLIPKCNKKDIISVLDDALSYIPKLQHQHQIMMVNRSCSMFHPPLMMMPQLGQQGVPFPWFAPFHQTHPLSNGIRNMVPPFNFGMSQLGLANASTSLPMEITPQLIQYPLNVSDTIGDRKGPSNE